jgi:hypothetical protein
MASQYWQIDDFRPPSTTRLRRCLFGLAWAGRRSLLQKHGFYDAMILGSGDRALACAGLGRFEDAIHMSCMSQRRATHYLEWAKPFHEKVQENMGLVEGNLLHLWHGDIADRKYVERHRGLAQMDFDPYADIALDVNGCWQWVTDKQAMHTYIREYFFLRKEDGERGMSAAGQS